MIWKVKFVKKIALITVVCHSGANQTKMISQKISNVKTISCRMTSMFAYLHLHVIKFNFLTKLFCHEMNDGAYLSMFCQLKKCLALKYRLLIIFTKFQENYILLLSFCCLSFTLKRYSIVQHKRKKNIWHSNKYFQWNRKFNLFTVSRFLFLAPTMKKRKETKSSKVQKLKRKYFCLNWAGIWLKTPVLSGTTFT
jgi:hypothetical protein